MLVKEGSVDLKNKEAPRQSVSDKGEPGSRSLRRAAAILNLLLDTDEPLPVSVLTARLGIPKSTAYEIVRTMAELNLLEANSEGTVFLGRKLFELGMAYKSHIDLMKEGSRVVEELRDETGETIQMSVLENDMMLVLLKEEGSMPVRIISRIGSRVPVNWAAAGRLLVSDLDDEALRAALARSISQSPTGRAAVDIDELIAQIRAARAQGYATELGEVNEHAGCVAAPVIDASGRCIAAISAAAPEQRLRGENRQRLIEAVTAAARALSKRLGAP
jgi:IclR family transcriptional regulator, KDG regulon repressor